MKSIFLALTFICFLINSLGYSFGALRQIWQSLRPDDKYFSRRLLLNLILANSSLYMISLVSLILLIEVSYYQNFMWSLWGICVFSCCQTLLTVSLLTPKDILHALPGFVALVFLIFTVAI